jgi:hypothetical protein
VRQAIAPALAAIPTAEQILDAKGLGGTLRGIEARSEKRAAFTGALRQALQDSHMSPTELGLWLAALEWRCLGRDQAEVFAIPRHFRHEFRNDQMIIASADLGPSTEDAGAAPGAGAAGESANAERAAAERRRLDDAGARLKDFEKLATGEKLAGAERTACEAHRTALAAFPPSDLAELECALDEGSSCN